MKRKQLIKHSRGLTDALILRYLEAGGRQLADYFLVGTEGHYTWGVWRPDGTPGLMFWFVEDEIAEYALTQYLLRHVPVYASEGDLPATRPGAGSV